MKIGAAVANRLNPKNKRVVLVLQGGGALGAYQAGVYHAMHEHDLIPDWVVGTSIGAINSVLIFCATSRMSMHYVSWWIYGVRTERNRPHWTKC